MPLRDVLRSSLAAVRRRRATAAHDARFILLTPKLLGRDGVSVVARHMARALLQAGLTTPPLIIALHDAPDESIPTSLQGASIIRCGGSRTRFVLEALRHLSRSVSTPTHVVANHLHVATVVLPALALGVELSLFLHSLEIWTPQRGLRRRTLQQATRLLTNSDHTRQRFLLAHPECASVETHVCLLAASDPPDPRAQTQPAQREQDLPRQPFALIVGRMPQTERHKGHDRLLEAWPAVQHRAPGLRLVVVGRGDDVPRLQAKAKRLGLVDNPGSADDLVTFTGGVDDARLAALLEACACFVMPCHDEGFGLVFVEAMAAGKPCIAGTGAPEEIVRDGIDGFIVNPDDQAQLIERIGQLCDDGALRTRMGEAARARAQSEFSEAAFSNRFLRAIGVRRASANLDGAGRIG